MENNLLLKKKWLGKLKCAIENCLKTSWQNKHLKPCLKSLLSNKKSRKSFLVKGFGKIFYGMDDIEDLYYKLNTDEKTKNNFFISQIIFTCYFWFLLLAHQSAIIFIENKDWKKSK